MDMTQQGRITDHREGYVPDPFTEYERLAGERGARLSMSVQRGADDYGQTKCSCNVTITCPQTTEALDNAAALAFDTALRYVNWGMQYLTPGVPPLPGPYSNAGNRTP